MKYLGEEKIVEVKSKVERPVLYMKCDYCGKIIKPDKYDRESNRYIRVHTWHSDWGNDSVESHEYYDYCPECAKKAITEYIDNANGSEELTLSNEYFNSGEKFRGHYSYLTEGYELANVEQEE